MVSLAPPRDTIRILVERLGWPVRMARWQAAREFGALLSDAEHGSSASEIYLEWLSERLLESEVVSGLVVLLCARRDDLPTLAAVAATIQRPSVLADEMLRFAYGSANTMDTWRKAHSGLAPPSFEPDSYFLKHKTAHAPPILSNTLDRIERKCGLPFFRQWAHEWQTLMETTKAPRSGFPYFFCNSMEKRSGLSGQFSQRQCDVYRSAYLRALACAVDHWEFPSDVAKLMSLVTLPASPGFLQVGPTRRPDWIGNIPDRYFDRSISASTMIEELTRRGASESGMRTIHFRLPLSMEVAEHSELSVTAVLVTGDFVPGADLDEALRLSLLWDLNGGILVEGPLPQRSIGEFIICGDAGSCAPLSLEVMPKPFGFWHSDYFQAGVRLPAPYAFDREMKISCHQDGISMTQNDTLCGTWRVWHDHWTPLCAKGGATRLGMLTEAHDGSINWSRQYHGLRLGWVVSMKIWRQAHQHDQLELLQRSEFVLE